MYSIFYAACAGTRFYIFSGDTLIGEYNGATAEIAYTWGPDGLVSKRKIPSTAASYWYHFGPQGETRVITDSSGSVTDTYRYNAYGKVLSSTGSTTNPYKYGGKYGYYADGGMNLMLATHRWYSPELMRWMSRDPIEYEGGDNLFAYVGENPVEYSDPTGLESKSNRAVDREFIQCVAQCMDELPMCGGDDALEGLGLWMMVGSIPKAWLPGTKPYPGSGPNAYTNLISYASLGAGSAASRKNFLRVAGRFGNYAALGYGNYLFGMEAVCAYKCL